MLDTKNGNQKVCERCLAMAVHHQDICPRCGYNQLCEMKITVQDGKKAFKDS